MRWYTLIPFRTVEQIMTNPKENPHSRRRRASICCIYNMGAHYRWPIFRALAATFPIDFCFGPDNAYTHSIKTFDYNKLPGFKRLLKNRLLPMKFYWQSGAVRQLFAPYKQYLMLGEAYCLSSWIVVMGARLTGRRAVCWTHGWYGRENAIKRRVSRVFYSMFNDILTYNNYSRELLIHGGIPAKKIHVLGNSLDSAAMRAMRGNLHSTDIYAAHFHNTLPTLIYCGRIQKSKHLELMIEAARKLKNSNKSLTSGNKGLTGGDKVLTGGGNGLTGDDKALTGGGNGLADGSDDAKTKAGGVNMVFVGKDSEGVDVPKMAREAGLEANVWMYGPCYDNGKLAELFFNAAACVSPGNVGLTAVHALSFGCPVITHGDFPWQGPEFECIKPGLTGDFFRRGDADDLARVIRNWIGHSPEQRRQTADAAFREIDAHWSVEHEIDVFKQVLVEKRM